MRERQSSTGQISARKQHQIAQLHQITWHSYASKIQKPNLKGQRKITICTQSILQQLGYALSKL